jgi:D-tyrosyl-tRNA(Tyr) deacylase
MRAVVQRVSRAQVTVDDEIVGRIAGGLCVLVGVAAEDTSDDARVLADKIVGLRIFDDEAGKMNQSVRDVGGGILAISQFTLLADVRKGRRPSFSAAMAPDTASELFEEFCALCRGAQIGVEQGRFRAHMRVELVNDGPVTIVIDTENLRAIPAATAVPQKSGTAR